MDWRDYQQRVADFFRQSGCEAIVESNIRGARAAHKIDVLVLFRRLGLENKWVIECKNWKNPVRTEEETHNTPSMSELSENRSIRRSRNLPTWARGWEASEPEPSLCLRLLTRVNTLGESQTELVKEAEVSYLAHEELLSLRVFH